jgi:hypothetical protein
MARSASDIQLDLDAAYAARRRILTYGQAKGADGANKSEVSLKDLQSIIAGLETELKFAGTCNAGISFTPTVGG